MNDQNDSSLARYFDRSMVGPALLAALFLVVNCVSMSAVLHGGLPPHPNFLSAAGATLLLASFVPLFALARFSFGYIVGIAFYGIIAQFIWLTYFISPEPAYDVDRARWSAGASLLLFLLPLLFQTWRYRPAIALSPQAMNRLLAALLCFAAVVLAWTSYYGVAFVGVQQADQLRDAIARPAVVRYLTGSLVGGGLPFAFAYFAWQRRYALAAASLLLIVGFYPSGLNKTVLLAVVWLPFLFLLFRNFEARRAAMLALLLPIGVGLVFYYTVPGGEGSGPLASYPFRLANIRMLGYPAIAMDRYSDFFSQHELTHFCQIGIVRAIRGCPYAHQLGIVMAERYNMGNLNASLFATEGIASVGPGWAPLSALLCGLALSIGNSVSARLPTGLVGASSGLVVQSLLNVPLSAAFLSNGLLLLLLLWAVTPALAVDGERR